MRMRNLVTTKKAAEILGVTPRQITRWALNGDIPHAHKVEGQTGSYLFDVNVIEDVRISREQVPS